MTTRSQKMMLQEQFNANSTLNNTKSKSDIAKKWPLKVKPSFPWAPHISPSSKFTTIYSNPKAANEHMN